MFVVKVQFGDVNRRLVLQEPFTFDSLLQTVVSRFDLKPCQALNAQLRYVDPDGDLISMNTDAELAEALALVNQSEVQALRMKLICSEISCESPKSEDSVVFISDSKYAFEERALQIGEDEKRRAEELLAKEAAERVLIEEENRKRVLEEQEAVRRAEELRMEEERALALKLAEEEERARAAKIAAEEQEKARIQEEEEQKQRCEIAVCAEKEDSTRRIQSLINMGCSLEVLETIFSKQFICEVVGCGKSESSNCCADPVVVAESFVDCMDSRADSSGESAVDETEDQYAPEPTVDWELQMALKEQETSGERFPSPQQKLAVLEAGQQAEDLATQLTEFYLIHYPEHVAKVPGLVIMYKSRINDLNRALMDRYHCDLTSFRTVAPLETPIDSSEVSPVPEPPKSEESCAAVSTSPSVAQETSVSVPAPPAAVSGCPPLSEKMQQAIMVLIEMGIEAPMERLRAVLEKHDCDVQKALTELFD